MTSATALSWVTNSSAPGLPGQRRSRNFQYRYVGPVRIRGMHSQTMQRVRLDAGAGTRWTWTWEGKQVRQVGRRAAACMGIRTPRSSGCSDVSHAICDSSVASLKSTVSWFVVRKKNNILWLINQTNKFKWTGPLPTRDCVIGVVAIWTYSLIWYS
jgi:hypothetical protein